MSRYNKEFRKVWATLDRMAVAREQAEVKSNKAIGKTSEAIDKINKTIDETNKIIGETNKIIGETNKTVNNISKSFGGFTDNASKALEIEFADAINKAKNIGGIQIHKAIAKVGEYDKNTHEFDLVAINGTSVFVGEIKTKLLPEDVNQFFKKRLPCFAKEFPEFAKGKKVIGMVGGQTITKDAAKKADEYGMYVIGLKNKKLVVNSSPKLESSVGGH